MLEAGSERVDLIEPEPANVAYLRERFSGDDRAIVHDAAAGERDWASHVAPLGST